VPSKSAGVNFGPSEFSPVRRRSVVAVNAQGLDGCSKLEELSLENNCIRRLEGASFWPQLRRLSLGHNFITTFEGSGLDKNGNRLQCLSAESNNITSLSGLQKVSGLVELYLSNNLIDSVREVFSLKVN
jgi:Leucine-rich repeat (LRR) protein